MLGYHGCDKAVAEKILDGRQFAPSVNDYDWLGTGVYFWEANPARGLQWAKESAQRPGSKIKTPYVIGAIIDLGLCLDLTTTDGIVRVAHESLSATTAAAGAPLPKNNVDGLRRNLDCAVINFLHEIRASEGDQPIQTVRGIFIEGKPIYPDAGFYEKTHVQIAVRDQTCIKGVFRADRPVTQ